MFRPRFPERTRLRTFQCYVVRSVSIAVSLCILFGALSLLTMYEPYPEPAEQKKRDEDWTYITLRYTFLLYFLFSQIVHNLRPSLIYDLSLPGVERVLKGVQPITHEDYIFLRKTIMGALYSNKVTEWYKEIAHDYVHNVINSCIWMCIHFKIMMEMSYISCATFGHLEMGGAAYVYGNVVCMLFLFPLFILLAHFRRVNFVAEYFGPSVMPSDRNWLNSLNYRQWMFVFYFSEKFSTEYYKKLIHDMVRIEGRKKRTL